MRTGFILYILISASLVTGAAGCGQKGPLYLPGESPEQAPPAPPTEAEPTATRTR